MKVLKISSMLVAVALLVASCGGGAEKETVEANDAQEVQASTGTDMMIDDGASAVMWVGFKDLAGAFKYSHQGTVAVSGGNVTVKDGALEGGKVMMNLAQIECTDEDLDDEGKGKLVGHLQSADFFDVMSYDEEGNGTVNEANATATFEITGVAVYEAPATTEGEEGEADEWMTANPTHNLTGNLTLRGTTKSITIPAHVEIAEGGVKASAKFYIDRTQWGVTYGAGSADIIAAAKDDYIRDEMGIGFDIVAKPAMAEAM
ncbi:MAG TPA: YceI family protein [Cytophagales bacterium]|nr:YceI family protein [Cytophagales bacterium]HAA18015.1 YceI family protein [Cytophagales bacterium]HAP63077.1 YceI family protein [Cytophagales bacterium]